jgi:hypothetical protein
MIVLINLAGVALGLLGLCLIFASFIPRWGGQTSDRVGTTLSGITMIVIGAVIYLYTLLGIL